MEGFQGGEGRVGFPIERGLDRGGVFFRIFRCKGGGKAYFFGGGRGIKRGAVDRRRVWRRVVYF